MDTDVPSHRLPAPGRLELGRAFVNTLDIEDGVDEIGTPEALAAWLHENDLLPRAVGVRKGDVPRATELREALREVLAGNHGGHDVDRSAVESVERAARRAKLEVHFAADGTARPEPAGKGVDGALGRILAAIADAQAEGTWERLKTCPADDCRWAFYDRSRNRSAVWCNMAICGNRAKVRGYRARRG